METRKKTRQPEKKRAKQIPLDEREERMRLT